MISEEEAIRAVLTGVKGDWQDIVSNSESYKFRVEEGEDMLSGYNIHVEGPSKYGSSSDGFHLRLHHPDAPGTMGLINIVAGTTAKTPAEAIKILNNWVDNKDRMFKERVMADKGYGEVAEKYTP